jgi:hypothetical protein
MPKARQAHATHARSPLQARLGYGQPTSSAGIPAYPYTLLKKISVRLQMLLDAKACKSTIMAVSEINRYLDTLAVDCDSDNDDPEWVISWWRANAHYWLIMSQVARDYLPIPLSEVDVERVFRSRRDLLGIRRHLISPEIMRAVMLLRN